MKKIFFIIIICVSFICPFGCGKKETQEQISPDRVDKVKIGVSFDSFVVERWIRDRDVFVSAAEELGAEVNVQNSNGDIQEQIKQIDYLIDKHMDVIVVTAGDRQALTNVMNRAKAAGIKTLCYDRLIENADCDLYISFDNEMVGELMAKSLVDNLEPNAEIFLIQGPTSDRNVIKVREGFDSIIKNSKLKVVYEANCADWMSEHAFSYVKEAILKHPDVKGVMCGNDDLATEVFRALAQERLAGKVIITGQDGDLVACQRIVEGTQEMTAFKPIEEEARLAAKYAYKLGKHEDINDVKARANDGSYDVPYLELKPIAVTKENMDKIIIKGGFHALEDVYRNTK